MKTIIRNAELLDLDVGTTYTRQVFLYNADLFKGLGYPYGETGWGAEFRLSNPSDASEIYSVCTIANGKMAWSAQGLLVWAIPAAETALFKFTKAHYFLDVIVPSTIVDPQGTRLNIHKGTLNCVPR